MPAGPVQLGVDSERRWGDSVRSPSPTVFHLEGSCQCPAPLERWGDASHAHGLAAWSVGSKAPPTQPTLMGGARVLSLSIHMVSGPANTRRLRTWDTGIKSGKGELAVTRAPAGGSWRPRNPSLVRKLEGAGEACCDRQCHLRGA